jgi:hypothetical protein
MFVEGLGDESRLSARGRLMLKILQYARPELGLFAIATYLTYPAIRLATSQGAKFHAWQGVCHHVVRSENPSHHLWYLVVLPKSKNGASIFWRGSSSGVSPTCR